MFSARAYRITAASAAVLALSAGGLYVMQSGGWAKWRSARYVRRAEALNRNGALEAARIACFRALTLDHASAGALKALLRSLPPGDLRATLPLHVRLADLDRSDRENLRALAFTAIAAERYELAEQAAADIARSKDGAREAQEWRARILAARGDFTSAATAAQALLKDEPNNVAGRLILALAQIFSDTDSTRAEQQLAALSSNPAVRVEALRGLREAALRRGDRDRASDLAKSIMAEPRASFGDALARADLVVQADRSQLEPQLADLTHRADNSPESLGAIARWLQKLGLADRIEAWAKTTEALQQDEPTSQMIRVEAFVALQSWKELAALIEHANWQAIDFLRQAFLARAKRELSEPDAANALWRAAATTALESGKGPRLLAETTKGWPRWQDERQKLLWSAAKRPENTRWALAELTREYEALQDTRSLRKVTEEWLVAEPTSVAARNNFAYYSLLLGTSPERARRLAEEVFASFPKDPAIASTQALSLTLNGDPAKALTILDALAPASAKRPGIAACRALALARAGRQAEAKTLFVTIDEKKLFPELRDLVRAALTP